MEVNFHCVSLTLMFYVIQLADSMTRYVERVLKNDPVLRKNCAEIKSTSSDKAFGDGFGIV